MYCNETKSHWKMVSYQGEQIWDIIMVMEKNIDSIGLQKFKTHTQTIYSGKNSEEFYCTCFKVMFWSDYKINTFSW